MKTSLATSIGQYSSQGRKAINQDCYGVSVPREPALSTKGIAVAIADGISSSEVSQAASQSSIRSFLEDYYCTSETWTVRTAAQHVLQATNAWLFAQNQRNTQFRLDKGYVCTFTALVFKSNTAYLFHIGDAQVIRLRGGAENKIDSNVLTEPHRRSLSTNKSYLARALGISQPLDIDYSALPLELGDIFLLTTDGVYEHISQDEINTIINANFDDLDKAAKEIAEQAYANGSDDNLTAQLVRIDGLPSSESNEFLQRANELPFPPQLKARMEFDGYQVIRNLHKSSRSHLLLAQDLKTQQAVVIKSPSTEGRQNNEYIKRFLMEQWIANRLNNTHIVKSHRPTEKPRYCYVVTEFVDGQTLTQWMIDNPCPNLDEVRSIIEQVAIGLQAFHRQEMLHQDLRPNNIMIDVNGTVKIIDFGSTFVAGVEETHAVTAPDVMPGTAQFLAPEYFLGEFGTKWSDIYSLACITYHMLSGRSPYGTAVAKSRTQLDQRRLVYKSVLAPQRQLPAWIDLCLKKGLQVDPLKRYAEISEFIQDLRKPNPKFIQQSRSPLLERDPVRFWQGVSAVLFAFSIVLLVRLLNP